MHANAVRFQSVGTILIIWAMSAWEFLPLLSTVDANEVSDSPPPLSAMQKGKPFGYVSAVSASGEIAGYAVDPAHPETAAIVRISYMRNGSQESVALDTIETTIPKPLINALYRLPPESAHGFYYQLPSDLLSDPEIVFQVEVESIDDDEQRFSLTRSPIQLKKASVSQLSCEDRDPSSCY